MVFSSLTFIYAFLPIVLVLYFICRNRIYRNVVLLIVSLVFYAWCEPKLILLMLAATLCAYAGGLLIARLDRREKAAAKKWVMAICVILMLGVLFLFKYLGLFVSTIDAIVGGMPEFKQLALPIGISFYTFQIISYIIDVYRRKVEAERNFFWLLLYVCLFPQLIVGPIVRYETVADDIRHRQESFGEFFEGLERFIFGLAKKVLISNTVAKLVTGIYGYGVGEAGTVFTWIATLAYTFQLYFDFSGYSDMALGLGRMFGFHFRENFNYPYASVSVAEFWRRWHISLGSWFRDYVYIPLGGNRVSRPRHLFNIMVVWGLTGFWHGAQWNFLIWGLYFGVLLVIEHFVLKKILEKTPVIIKWAGTFFFVVVGRVFFYNESIDAMWEVFRVLFTWVPGDFVTVMGSDTTMIPAFFVMPIAMLLSFPVFKPFVESKGTLVSIIRMAVCAALFILSIMFLLSSSYNPFIYFRF